ncbi:MAG: guanylate kinase [Oscillospiraceae bacterium]|nr:guanylate kinase [Oscillospiraceae bacterium]
MKQGILFVMSGPSGTGKGTVCAELLKNKDNNLFLSISTTSRNIRAGEIDGVTYNYTTPEKFREMAESGCMLEWAVYGGNYYGTPKKSVLERLDRGENVLLEIDVQGALKVKKAFDDAVLIFIVPPSTEELRRRLESRGRENEDQINERIKAAEFELDNADKYDYIAVNDDLASCVESIRAIMKAEQFRARRNTEFTERLKK